MDQISREPATEMGETIGNEQAEGPPSIVWFLHIPIY